MKKFILTFIVYCLLFYPAISYSENNVLSQKDFVESNRELLCKLIEDVKQNKCDECAGFYDRISASNKCMDKGTFLKMLGNAATYELDTKIENPYALQRMDWEKDDYFEAYLIYIDFQENKNDGKVTENEVMPVLFFNGRLYDIGWGSYPMMGNLIPARFFYQQDKPSCDEIELKHAVPVR